jgi:hypothetical protein
MDRGEEIRNIDLVSNVNVSDCFILLIYKAKISDFVYVYISFKGLSPMLGNVLGFLASYKTHYVAIISANLVFYLSFSSLVFWQSILEPSDIVDIMISHDLDFLLSDPIQIVKFASMSSLEAFELVHPLHHSFISIF